jgi:hypothetical protein
LAHGAQPALRDEVPGVREAIEKAGATLRYLPKYSPDLNPIELRSFEAVEFATLGWVDWFNNRRILEPSAPEGSWLSRMLARKPLMLVARALANKMASTAWAMLIKQENYRVPVMMAA